MAVICDTTPQASPIVVIVDMASKDRKTELFETLPENIKYKSRRVKCNDVEKLIMVPVAEIRVSPTDSTGRLVQKDLATSLLIEYFDKDGNALEVVRMAK